MATIQGIYVALFGRPADPAGLAFFNEATNNGADLTAIGDLAATAEYQDRFTGLSNAEIINSIYQSLFGRDGEQSGIDFFLAALEDGTYNINNIAIAILDGAQGDDLATINAKIAAAELLTERLDQQIEVDAYVGSDAAEIARNYISNVNKDDPGTESEADAAIAQMLDLQGGQAPGDDTGGNPDVVEIEATGSVAISDAKEGGTVSISYPQTIEDGNGPVTLSYQWQKLVAGVWVDELNETGATYDVDASQNEVGDEIRVVVTSTDDSGYTTVFTSNEDTIDNVNDAPVLTSSSVVTNVNENNVATVVADLSTTDDDGNAVSLSLSGQDASYFTIDVNGDLVLNAGVDYEILAANNKTLDVTVTATDNSGAANNTDSADFSVTIGNVAEAITVTNGGSFAGTSGNDTFDVGNSVRGATITGFNSADDVVNLPGTPDQYAESNGIGSFFGIPYVKGIAEILSEVNSHFSNNDNDVFVVYNANNSGDAWVYFDRNGSGSYEAQNDTFLVLTGVDSAAKIGASDFI